ncbi:MAG: hypothetical protein GXO87_09530 [Chlorobi bacterium]|nr:hypothetical protein [Chlorobiota bacterium]
MKYLPVFLFVTFFSTVIFSQDVKNEEDYSAHGIQFQIGSNFQLESFDGLTFSYLYRVNKNYFFRFGIGTSLSLEDASTTAGEADTLEHKGNADRYGITLSGDLIFTLVRKNGFSMIAGGGPFVTYHYSRNYSNKPTGNQTYDKTDVINEWNVGLGLLIGAQFELNENIVFSGEYGLNIGYNSKNENFKQTATTYGNTRTLLTKIEINSFNISNSAFKFGVAVYF